MASSDLRSNQHDAGGITVNTRLRSGTAGSADEARTAASRLNAAIKRPSHLRSRSYLSSLSPVEPKPRNATTLPAEASAPMHTNGTTSDDPPMLRQRESESYVKPSGSKLHLPGHKSRFSQDLAQGGKDGFVPQRSHLHILSRTNSHRHTKSDVPARWNIDNVDRNRSQPHLAIPDTTLLHPAVAAAKGTGMLTRISSNLSGKNVGPTQHKPRHQYSVSDLHKGKNPVGISGLTRPTSRPDLRRRATSDTRTPIQQTMRDGMAARYGVATYIDGPVPIPQERRKPLTEVDLLLLRAEKQRKEEEANMTEADVQKLVTQLAESRVALQEQLANNTRNASSLMRRLDDAHDALFSTASAMIDTISSFQNMCQQSEALTANFELRSAELDKDTRKKLEKHRKALFEQRGKKIEELEERGRKANGRAEEMSRRLENCRTVIKNYSDREQTKRRAWRGVMMGTLSGACVIVLGFLLGIGLWYYKHYGGDVRYDIHDIIASALDQNGLIGAHGHINQMVKDKIRGQAKEEARRKVKVLDNVPKEVQSVLDDIAQRHNTTHSVVIEEKGVSRSEQYSRPTPTGDIDDDQNLSKLFDKLEL